MLRKLGLILFFLVLSALAGWADTVTVTCTTPTNNETVTTSSVEFTCTSSDTGGYTLTGWNIWVDSVEKFSTSGPTNHIDQFITLGNGTHSAVVKAWDSHGTEGDLTIPFTVNTNLADTITVTCTQPPQNYSSSDTTVPFSCSATSSAGHTITAWDIYIDSVLSWQGGTNQSQISTSISGVSVGAHAVQVKAWDSAGTNGYVNINITITNLPQDTVTVTCTSPTNNQQITGQSVPFACTFSSSGNYANTGWHIYIDGVDTGAQPAGSTLSVTLNNITYGTHTAVVRAWDTAGNYGSLSIPFTTVQGGGGGLDYTTHLAAETGNNTSASNLFPGAPDGNEAPTNISKVNTHTLMYTNSTTYVYAHLEPWFCTTNGQGNSCGGHMYVGYNSDDPLEVQAQVTDMESRGLAGLVIDWYGKPYGSTNNNCPHGTTHCIEDGTAQVLFPYLNSLCTGNNCPFTAHLMEDYGSFTSRCENNNWQGNGYSSQQACVIALLETDLSWMSSQYWGSVSYLKAGGKPYVGVFAYESGTQWSQTNWTTVWNTVSSYAAGLANSGGGPIFYFENTGGFNHTASDGGFAWVHPNRSDPNDWAKSYLDNFYHVSDGELGTEWPFGASYKGFNDTLAGWGSNRIMNQNCGQTWLNSIHEANNYFSGSQQLPFMELVTWNDYDEGSEIETGIDSCNTVTATLPSGTTTMQWTYSGSASVIDHFTVYATQDSGSDPRLAVLEDNIPVSTTSVNLASFPALSTNGTYYIYVKAVSKPSLKNAMSGSVTYMNNASTPPSCSLSVVPPSGNVPLLITANGSCSDPNGQIASITINWGDGSPLYNGSVGTHTYVTSGTYTVTITATDVDGQYGTAMATVTATGAIGGTFTLMTPGPHANIVYSPVRFAFAVNADNLPLQSIAIAVDNVQQWITQGAGAQAVDRYIFMTPGSHVVTLSAVDSLGNPFAMAVPLYVAKR